MKGLLVNVYRDKHDCTNEGISSRHDRMVLTGDGIPEIFEPSEREPEIRLVYRPNINYYHAEPTEGKRPHCAGWFFGGNFIHTSDSRFPNRYPIPIHDRQETRLESY